MNERAKIIASMSPVELAMYRMIGGNLPSGVGGKFFLTKYAAERIIEEIRLEALPRAVKPKDKVADPVQRTKRGAGDEERGRLLRCQPAIEAGGDVEPQSGRKIA